MKISVLFSFCSLEKWWLDFLYFYLVSVVIFVDGAMFGIVRIGLCLKAHC